MSEQALPCIVCGKNLLNVYARDDGGFNNQPHDGIAFYTHGHYGSTVFDPGHTYVRMEISVCDQCITEADGYVAFSAEAPRMPRRRVTAQEASEADIGMRRRPRRKRIPRRTPDSNPEGNQ
jgi:hypothetical protein